MESLAPEEPIGGEETDLGVTLKQDPQAGAHRWRRTGTLLSARALGCLC